MLDKSARTEPLIN